MLGKAQSGENDASVTRGRYLVAFGGCNDCHTPGWRESDGKLPAGQWMIGNTIGFRGPWGVVYPANVRLEFQEISESAWLMMVRTRGGRPPMPWADLRQLTQDDQRAIYRFIRSLGPAGAPSPFSVPPDKEAPLPYYELETRGPGTNQ